MALDAFVYCDCFEKDQLRSSPPSGLELRVGANGEVTCHGATDQQWSIFCSWRHRKACPHVGMILKHHRLGTAKQIDALRDQLENKERARFPILINKILYTGTHTCDWVPLNALPELTEELKQMNPPKTPEGDALRHLKIQLAELIIAAQMMQKPICF